MAAVEIASYNPEADARHLWIPSGAVELDRIVQYRKNPVTLQGGNEQRIQGYQLLAVEAIDYYDDIERAAAAANVVGVTEATIEEADTLVRRATEVISKRLFELVDSRYTLSESDRLLLVGDLMNRGAHFLETRENDSPYDSHPRAVCQSIFKAARRLNLFEDDQDELLLTMFEALTHDAPEHAFSPTPSVSARASERLHVSPQLVSRVLHRGGFDKKTANEAGLEVGLLTHVIGVDGEDEEYVRYLLRALAKPRPASVKTADIHDNDVLDPKQEPKDAASRKRWADKKSWYSNGLHIGQLTAQGWVTLAPDHSVLIRSGIPNVTARSTELLSLTDDPLPVIQINHDMLKRLTRSE